MDNQSYSFVSLGKSFQGILKPIWSDRYEHIRIEPSVYTRNYFGKQQKIVQHKLPNGKLHSTFEEYYPNGILMQKFSTVDGLFEGQKFVYDERGTKIKCINFVNGKRSGLCELWSSAGRLTSRINFIDDIANGSFEVYHFDGSLALSFFYKNGKLEGLCTIYYPNSKVVRKISYKNNLKHGSDILCDQNGNIAGYCEYDTGKRTTAEYIDDNFKDLMCSIGDLLISWQLYLPPDSHFW